MIMIQDIYVCAGGTDQQPGKLLRGNLRDQIPIRAMVALRTRPFPQGKQDLDNAG